MEFTADNLEKAVTMFYRSEAAGQQQADAHKWLTEAQNSPQAWGFVWELLNTQRTSEVQFFAATTLHTKILKHWNEVPVDCYEELKKKILATIVNYATGPKLVLNRLCITLSAYIIHTIPTYWPKAFEELVSSFQPHHLPNVEPERVIWILLEILTVIPEEFQSVTLAVSHKNKVRAVLQDVSKDILRVIQMCLMPIPAAGFSMTNLTTYLNAARCASTWVQLGGLNIDDVALLLELLIDLICFIYWNRGDAINSGSQISPAAFNAEDLMVGMAEASLLNCDEMEVIEYAVEAVSAIFQHPNTSKYRQHIIKYTANLLYKFEKILEVERNSCELNKEIVMHLYNIIINIADNHAKIFIQNLKSSELDEQKLSFDLLNSILKCSNLPGIYPIDESSSILTFGFWYTLQDEVLNLDAAECAQLLITIKPYYRNLVCIMLNKSMYPITDDEWSLDDQEVFRCYRQDIADTYTYSYNVLNLEMLDILQCKLTAALTALDSISKGQQQQHQVLWNEIETCLHAYGAVAESIEMENEHVYLPKFFITLKTIPFAALHVKVLASALEAIGSYSEWFTDHPSMIEHVLPLIVHALSNPEVATSATLALKDVAQSCHRYLIPYADHILISCKNVLESGLLKLAESRRLMFSIGKMLSVLPLPKIMDYLNMLLAPSFDELNELINNSTEPQSAGVINSLVTRLKLLSSLFNSLYVEDIAKTSTLMQQQQEQPPQAIEQPVLIILKNTMHIYKQIAEKYSHNLDVTDDLSILLKNSVATLKEDCKPLINDILHIVLTLYKECPQWQVLVVAKTVLILFGKDEEFLLVNTHLLYELTTVTIQLCIQLNANSAAPGSCSTSLSEKSDVIEAYFEMMAQMIKKVPHLLYLNTNKNIDHEMLFQCATMCLVLHEVQTIKSISNYLVHFITHSREVSQASAVVQAHGETLVMRILMSLGITAPRTCAEPLGDILFALNKKYCDNLSRWLNSLLVAQNGFPSPRITTQQKSNFIKCILREKANKRKVSEYVLEFMLICKGIIKIDPSL